MVKGEDVLIVDDLIDTAGTFVGAVNALKQKGARDIYGSITHPLLSGHAVERIEASELKKLFVSDTIPFRGESDKIEVLTASEIFSEAIRRTFNNESISSLFDVDKS